MNDIEEEDIGMLDLGHEADEKHIKKIKTSGSQVINPNYDTKAKEASDEYEVEYISDNDENEDDLVDEEGFDREGLKPKKKKVQHSIISSSVKEDVIVEFEDISVLERIYSWTLILLAFYMGRLTVRWTYIYLEKFGMIEPLDPALLANINQLQIEQDEDEEYE